MIPANIYHSKVSDLRDVLGAMGAEPASMAAWLIEEQQKGDLHLAKAKSSAYASLALVQAMPKFEGTSVLGLRLTESKQAQKRAQILEDNQNVLYSEIDQLENIKASLHEVLGMVAHRIYIAKRVRETLADRAREGGRGGPELDGQVSYIDKNVLPLLKALQAEIEKAIATCAKDITARRNEIEIIDKRQLALPKYSRKVRRRRLARVKARAAAEAAAKAAAAQGTEKKPEGKDGG